MKIEDPEGRTYHGRMGNVIYYSRGGKTYARRVSKDGKKRKKKERSEEQQALSSRFSAIQRMYQCYCREVSAEIWRAAAREVGMMGPNLFHKANYRCVDGEGRMAAPEEFQFSAGKLLLPWNMAVEAAGSGGAAEGGMAGTGSDGETGKRGMEGEGVFRVRWREDREGATAGARDVLRVGVLYERLPMVPVAALEVSGRREDGEGWFRLDTRHGSRTHVYVFFAREDGGAFSPSKHFTVTI